MAPTRAEPTKSIEVIITAADSTGLEKQFRRGKKQRENTKNSRNMRNTGKKMYYT